MTTQARVGIFTLLALGGIFFAYYFVTNFALRHSGYDLGVHFHNVGGLQEGSSVLISGVQVGEVTSVELLPDQTVDVISTINPGNHVYRDSAFVVAITITGATTLTIEPPLRKLDAMILPEHPLPIAQQPWGTLPPTLTDLVSAGQEQLKNFSKTMNVVNKELPALAERFAAVANHTDRLILHADSEFSGLTGQLEATVASLNLTLDTSGRNINELTGNVNGLVRDNRKHFGELVTDLSKTAENLNKTMAGVASIAQDPLLHESLVGTAQNVRDATAKLKAIATDLENVTGDPETQSKLKNTISNLEAVSAKADAVLGTFTTSENDGQTPGPVIIVPVPVGSGAPQPANTASPGPLSIRRPSPKHGLLGQPIVQAQVRETWGTRGGGPASDLNLVVLPSASTHLTLGANDLGYHTTYNFLRNKGSANLQLGAGVLYSKLGLAALFRPFGSPIGIDARLYDPKHPNLDLYGDLRLTERLQLFYGQRNIWNAAGNSTAFGIQVKY
jgi:ABC-type transporter Mla subunit MlaD